MKAATLGLVLCSLPVISLGLLEPMRDKTGEANVDVVADHVALLEQKLQDLTNRYEATAAELASLRNQQPSGTQHTGVKEILFQIKLQNDLNQIRNTSVLVFDTVVYNTGGGYDATTGKFTASASGAYLFWCYATVNDNDSIQIELVQNGKVQAAGFGPHHREGRVASVITLIQLQKGDQVWMTKLGTASFRGSGLSSFGGVLLYPH